MRGIIAATIIVEAENDIQARDIALYAFPYEVEVLSIDPVDVHVFEIQMEVIPDEA